MTKGEVSHGNKRRRPIRVPSCREVTHRVFVVTCPNTDPLLALNETAWTKYFVNCVPTARGKASWRWYLLRCPASCSSRNYLRLIRASQTRLGQHPCRKRLQARRNCLAERRRGHGTYRVRASGYAQPGQSPVSECPGRSDAAPGRYRRCDRALPDRYSLGARCGAASRRVGKGFGGQGLA